MTSIEFAHAMHERTITKITELKPEIRSRITIKVQDVLKGAWGNDYTIITMEAYALYELPSAKSQEKRVKFTSEALVSGGNLFIDNDDRKDSLTKDMIGETWIAFKGRCNDGTYGELSARIINVDIEKQIQCIERQWYTISPDGIVHLTKYTAQKHPVSLVEIEAWLYKYNFEILCALGDRQGTPFTKDSERAIFWARKTT